MVDDGRMNVETIGETRIRCESSAGLVAVVVVAAAAVATVVAIAVFDFVVSDAFVRGNLISGRSVGVVAAAVAAVVVATVVVFGFLDRVAAAVAADAVVFISINVPVRFAGCFLVWAVGCKNGDDGDGDGGGVVPNAGLEIKAGVVAAVATVAIVFFLDCDSCRVVPRSTAVCVFVCTLIRVLGVALGVATAVVVVVAVAVAVTATARTGLASFLSWHFCAAFRCLVTLVDMVLQRRRPPVLAPPRPPLSSSSSSSSSPVLSLSW